ncbi:MAG: phage tail protein I [Schwartzia sp.]|nr:phage tail protein I [Schwartzia sp. (in: firmicutes)]
MIKDLPGVSLLDILPENILADEKLNAAARALDDEMQKVTAATKEVLFLAYLDYLPETIIDLLAWQWHVDFYEPVGMDIETKRKMIKESIAWHRIKGTPAAVEKVVSAAFDKSEVTEWFEYDGEPYHFRISVAGMDAREDLNGRLLRAIWSAKNERSWLDGITVDINPRPEEVPARPYMGVGQGKAGLKKIGLPRPAGPRAELYTAGAHFRTGRRSVGLPRPIGERAGLYAGAAVLKTGIKWIGGRK